MKKIAERLVADVPTGELVGMLTDFIAAGLEQRQSGNPPPAAAGAGA